METNKPRQQVADAVNNDDVAIDEVSDDSDAEKRVKGKLIVCPWKTIADYEQVFDWLYGESANSESRQKANDEMAIWIGRRHNLTPAGVFATKVLLEVQLKEEQGVYTYADLQNFYSFALMRFLNFMSSTLQKHKMRSMYEIAEQLGLNTHIVDLRHHCAHSEKLPPVNTLQMAVNYCMNWLKGYYWETQRGQMRTVMGNQLLPKNRSVVGIRVGKLFIIFDIALQCHMQGAIDMKEVEQVIDGRLLEKLKNYCLKRNLQSLHNIFDTLVVELTALHKKALLERFPDEIYIDSFLEMKYFFTISAQCEANSKVLENVIGMTQRMFQMLAKFAYLEEIVRKLTWVADHKWTDDTRRAGASFWAVQILTGYAAFRKVKCMILDMRSENPKAENLDYNEMNRETMLKSVRKVLVTAGVNLKRTLVIGESKRWARVWQFYSPWVKAYLDNINVFTTPILEAMLPWTYPTKGVEALSQLITLWKDSNSSENKKPNANDAKNKQTNVDVVYTAEHLKSLLNPTLNESAAAAAEKMPSVHPLTASEFHERVERKRKNEDEEDPYIHYGIFKKLKVPNVDWSSIPLGCEPWE